LRPGRRWRRHRPGQHVRIGVIVDGRELWRNYSISSAPLGNDDRFTITVKAMPGGRVSNFLVHELEPGDHISLGLPEGDFILPEGARPLFITGGSGITPVMSMLRTFAFAGAMPDAAHIHYAVRARDVIFGRELSALAGAYARRYRLSLVYTEGGALFSEGELERRIPDWRERDVFVCGPAPLLDAVGAHFSAAGLSHKLHIERFHTPPTLVSGEAGTARFLRSDVSAASDGQTSLLEVAERAGVNAPYGCRMGACHSCDATLLAGCVRDLRTGEQIDEAGARIQPCISAAAGDVDLDL
jgi:ferredoxin-NADP reductase